MTRLACLLTITLCLSGIFVAPAPALAAPQPLKPWDDDRVAQAWNFGQDTQGWEVVSHLAPLKIVNGALQTDATGDDAGMYVNNLDLDTSGVTHLTCRMRATGAGACQVYFVTTEGPNPSQNEIPIFWCAGDNQFRDFEVRLDRCKGWGGRLRQLRLDPVNGAYGSAAHIEIEYLRLMQKAPRLSITKFAPGRVVAAPGEPVEFSLTVDNLGDGQPDGLEVTMIGPGADFKNALPYDKQKKAYVFRWSVTPPPDGVAVYYARVSLAGRLIASAEAGLVAPEALKPEPSGQSRAAVTERGAIVENGLTALVLFKGETGLCGGALWTRRSERDAWQRAGISLPLAMAALDTSRTTQIVLPQFEQVEAKDGALVLTHELPGGLGRIELTLSAQPGQPLIQAETRLVAGAAAGLLRLAGPNLLAGEGSYGEQKDGALFPGIEYLDKGQRSSDIESVGDTCGIRSAPSPYQITVPLMAVQGGGVLCGLMWDALQKWDGAQVMPRAEFASPNFLDGQANHLMGLFVPGYPAWTLKNGRQAVQSYPLQPGAEIKLRENLFALPGADLTRAVPLWYQVYGTPAKPQLAKPAEKSLDDMIQGWAQTCYDPQTDGFCFHWRIGQHGGPGPDIKARIFTHHLATGEDRWVRSVNIPTTATVLGLLGPLFPGFGGAPPVEQMNSQRPDGTWIYHVTPEIVKRTEDFTQGGRHDLGAEGSTCLGLCATNAAVILGYAVQTGDPRAVASGLKALEAMMHYKVPAGSQTWEVHKDAPDIYAAALAVQSFHAGYQLTGDKRYLDQAVYWAYTGLPFLYSWAVPGAGAAAHCPAPGDSLTSGTDPGEGYRPATDLFHQPARNITPYGSIPVFGTSFYVVSWFGALVQWCGLCWADAVYPLLDEVNDPLLRAAADGVVYSALAQTFDKEPYVGLLPDSWHVEPDMAFPTLISPVRTESALRKMLHAPGWTEGHTRVLRQGSAHQDAPRVHLTTRGEIIDPSWVENRLEWTQRYLAGQTCDAVAIGLAEPKQVMVDGKELPRVSDAATCAEGWQYLPDAHRLLLRVRHGTERVKVSVE